MLTHRVMGEYSRAARFNREETNFNLFITL